MSVYLPAGETPAAKRIPGTVSMQALSIAPVVGAPAEISHGHNLYVPRLDTVDNTEWEPVDQTPSRVFGHGRPRFRELFDSGNRGIDLLGELQAETGSALLVVCDRFVELPIGILVEIELQIGCHPSQPHNAM